MDERTDALIKEGRDQQKREAGLGTVYSQGWGGKIGVQTPEKEFKATHEE